jgi:hypothetical protein
LPDAPRLRAVFFAFLAFAFLASAAALLAFFALAARCSAVIVSKDRLPPIRPPLAPCSLKNLRTSDGSLFTVRHNLNPVWAQARRTFLSKGGLDIIRDMRCAIYARVSTADQTCDNQLIELHRYIAARGWTGADYVDEGISGAKDRRPALDKLLADARRRRFDVLVVWRLDRLGRNLRHLVTLLEDVQALGIAFVSLAEGIDATTPAGKLQMP